MAAITKMAASAAIWKKSMQLVPHVLVGWLGRE